MSAELRRHWALDPELTYLNHGSFGACPREVLAYQDELRARLERNPGQFFNQDYWPLLDETRHAIAGFFGADAQGLALVPNATFGVNAVLQSLQFEPGDELLTTSLNYPACQNTLEAVAARWGAQVVVADIALPVESASTITERLLEAASPRTALVMVDHIASATAIVHPIAEIVSAFEAKGVPVLIDGAHGPGMCDLDLAALGAAFYTGNGHKWLCSPRGAAILWTHPAWRDRVRPPIISHGASTATDERSRYRLEFDWIGTHDVLAYLCLPRAIACLEAMLPGGWPAIREHNHALTLEARDRLMSRFGLEPASHEPALLGSMVSLKLPELPSDPQRSALLEPELMERLRREHRVEILISQWPASRHRLVRVSSHLYTSPEDLDRLVEALATVLD